MIYRPWLALPYGEHVDALLTAASRFTEDEWADMPAILPPTVQGVVRATDALEADRGAAWASRLAPALRAAAGIGDHYSWSRHVVLAPALMLCAAHMVGREGVTVESIRAACEPARKVPALAAIVGAALDDLTERTKALS